MKRVDKALVAQSIESCRGSGRYLRGECKLCPQRTGKPDRRGSFSFNAETGWYQCFKCGLTGRLEGYEAAEFSIRPETLGPPEIEPPEGFVELMSEEGQQAHCLSPARRYLRKRGLTDESLWQTARLGFCVEGYFEARVIIPILSPEGIWRGYVARSTVEGALSPYLYPFGMERAKVIYNHAALLEESDQPVLVVEGVFDSLALWPDAVALLGSASGEQMDALIASRRPVVFVLDGDAWETGRQLSMTLRMEGQRAGFVRLPPKKDPDEVDKVWLCCSALASLSA